MKWGRAFCGGVIGSVVMSILMALGPAMGVGINLEMVVGTIFDANLGPALGASIMDMGNRFRIVANIVDVVPTDEALPNLPVARALWIPRPNLKTAAAAWIYAGGAHHTSFSYAVTADHLRDFADMAGIEFLLIDENTRVDEFKDKLRWNDLYYHLNRAL